MENRADENVFFKVDRALSKMISLLIWNKKKTNSTISLKVEEHTKPNARPIYHIPFFIYIFIKVFFMK